MYIPKRPRKPFLRPYQPPIGLLLERPHASTVPSFASFSSLVPSVYECFSASAGYRGKYVLAVLRKT